MKPLFFWLAAGYCALIFWLSSQVDPPQPEFTFPLKDKVSHIVLYGVLAAIISVGMWKARTPHSLSRIFWVPVIFVFAFGLTDEFHQLTVPGRFFDPFDVVANVVGAVLASLVLHRVYLFEAKYRAASPSVEEAVYAEKD